MIEHGCLTAAPRPRRPPGRCSVLARASCSSLFELRGCLELMLLLQKSALLAPLATPSATGESRPPLCGMCCSVHAVPKAPALPAAGVGAALPRASSAPCRLSPARPPPCHCRHAQPLTTSAVPTPAGAGLLSPFLPPLQPTHPCLLTAPPLPAVGTHTPSPSSAVREEYRSPKWLGAACVTPFEALPLAIRGLPLGEC